MAFHATILTLFPELFPGPLASGLSGQALSRGDWTCTAVQLRDYATDKHRTVDDTPYGGGAGMVLRPDVIATANRAARQTQPDAPVIYLSPRGAPLTQTKLESLAQQPAVTLLCGRYEGVDQRVLDSLQSSGGGEVIASVQDDSSIIEQMSEVLAHPFQVGFADSMSLVLLGGAGVLSLGFLLLLLLPPVELRTSSASVAASAEEKASREA